MTRWWDITKKQIPYLHHEGTARIYFWWSAAHKNNSEKNYIAGCRQTKKSNNNNDPHIPCHKLYQLHNSQQKKHKTLSISSFLDLKIKKQGSKCKYALLFPPSTMESNFESYVNPWTTNLTGPLVNVTFYCQVLWFCLWCFPRSSRATQRTTLRIPIWYPIVVLTEPEDAELCWADGNRCCHFGITVSASTATFLLHRPH